MIFRAIFWIGLVSVLMPHEPDLGLGRPGAGPSLAARMTSTAVAGLSGPDSMCAREEAACAGGLGVLDSLQGHAVRGLAEVKADLDAARQARSEVFVVRKPELRQSGAARRNAQQSASQSSKIRHAHAARRSRDAITG